MDDTSRGQKSPHEDVIITNAGNKDTQPGTNGSGQTDPREQIEKSGETPAK